MNKSVSPVAVVIAVIVLAVVIWVIYKFTLGKPTTPPAKPGVVPEAGTYSQGMPRGMQPSSGMGTAGGGGPEGQ